MRKFSVKFSPPVQIPSPVFSEAHLVMDIFLSNRICQTLPPRLVEFDPTAIIPIEKNLILKTDGHEFEVNVAAALESRFLRNIIECMKRRYKDDVLRISLDGKVSSHVLGLIVEFFKKHHLKREEDYPSSDSDHSADESDERTEITRTPDVWSAYYGEEVDQPTLLKLILAADFLMIRSLLNLTCDKVADMIKGKPVNDMREFFKLENDLTPEEEKNFKQYVGIT